MADLVGEAIKFEKAVGDEKLRNASNTVVDAHTFLDDFLKGARTDNGQPWSRRLFLGKCTPRPP